MVGIKPKPQFMGLFQFMDTHSGSPTTSENKSPEPDDGSELALTGWWRRGREPVSEVKRLDESRKHWHQYFYSSHFSTKYCGYTSTADAFRRGKVFLRQARYLKYGLVVLVAFEPSEMAVHE